MIRRTASEVLRSLEMRVSRLEGKTATRRTAAKKIRLDRNVEQRVMREIADRFDIEMDEDSYYWHNPVFEVLAEEKGSRNVSEGSIFQLLKLANDDYYVVLQVIPFANDSDIIGVYDSISDALRDFKLANR